MKTLHRSNHMANSLSNTYRHVTHDLLGDTLFDIYLDSRGLYAVGMLSIGTASMAISTSMVYGMAVVSQSLYPVSMTFLAIAGVGGMATCVGLGFLAMILSGYVLLQMLAVPITLGIWVLQGTTSHARRK